MRVDDGDGSDSDSDVAFASLDFSGVKFDSEADAGLSETDLFALAVEHRALFSEDAKPSVEGGENTRIHELFELLSSGKYKEALMGESAKEFFGGMDLSQELRMAERIRDRVLSYCVSVASCVEVELLAVAAFNLFLQLNYTGPSLDRGTSPTDMPSESLAEINPHSCFQSDTTALTPEEEKKKFHNAVLAELAVDGEWPCQVCQMPYLLLVARSTFFTLASPQRMDWTHSVGTDTQETKTPLESVPVAFTQAVANLNATHLWSARAGVAHERLVQGRESSVTLWNEVKDNFQSALVRFCERVDTSNDISENMDDRKEAATVVLEWGLAQHHFNRQEQGKLSFRKAMEYSGLQVEVTGAVGKRTKFQKDAKAQMVVRATSMNPASAGDEVKCDRKEQIKAQMIEHGEDGILLERIKFDDDKENQLTVLSTLDQSILLSLCLDVKANNPADGLTAEQMGAYLARVLDRHDDWMIYSTALLERAWLECEKVHGRERAILQIQALTDQHTNRLTLTQSTFESIEESAPPQERLKNIHSIVYPPRWAMLRDLGERYAKLGIVTSAAELFEEIELWDEVVECYRRAGKLSKAEQIVRERLAESETPRMWAALGDLTNDPTHYQKALELSNGRFSNAYVALGKYHFDKGELESAAEYYRNALKIRPLMPNVWFLLGTISMQLGDWGTALASFSEVVQQEPEEGDAWANVAAVHMHNNMPAEAYPALNESLKYNRNNWRVWISKLYTCIDLKRYDEAIQACNVLMDLKSQTNASEAIPAIEERCARAIVGGSLDAYREGQGDKAATDSSRRTLARVHELLERLSSSTKTEAWIWEVLAYFNEQMGRKDEVLQNLMKEYRALQTVRGWERDQNQVQKVAQVLKHIASFHAEDGSKESLVKCKLLLSGVTKKIQAVYLDESEMPEAVAGLVLLQQEIDDQIKALAAI